jgi:DnaJ family protein C protein 9
LIAESKIPDLPRFTAESSRSKRDRVKRLEGERAEAEQAAVELGLDTEAENSLRNAISERQESRGKDMDSFLDQLAAKYGGEGANKTTKNGKK